VWEVPSFFSEIPPQKDDVEDEEEEEMNFATLQRLKNADERTKNMTREEYVHWSDCRQASFTYRKGKRFKEWAGFGLITDSKPSDDIIDILGFLTFEIVQTLTEEALRVKDAEDVYKKTTGGESQSRKRKRERGLFDPPEEAREPVQPAHVQEAYRRLQRGNNKSRAMLNFTKGVPRSSLKLVSDITVLGRFVLTVVDLRGVAQNSTVAFLDYSLFFLIPLRDRLHDGELRRTSSYFMNIRMTKAVYITHVSVDCLLILDSSVPIWSAERLKRVE
jgi:hypothetical protein